MGNLFKSEAIFQKGIIKNPSKKFLAYIIITVGSCLTEIGSEAQTIAGWNFWNDNFLVTKTATTANPDLVSPIDLTRGPNAPASTGADSYRTTGFRNDGISTANTDFFEVKLSAKPGFEVSLFTIDAIFQGTNTFVASPGVSNQFAYSLDGINFILIGSPSIIIGQGKALPQIKLNGIAALQNVPSGITITIRYYASGQTTTGGWGFFSPLATSNGFEIGGSVTAVTFLETYYRSRQNGDWSSSSTWESSPDKVSWYAATKAPTKDAEDILIKLGHTVKVTSPVSFDQTTIAGILELQNGGVLNINDGVGDDLSILSNGILKILTGANYSTSINQIANATINIATGGLISIGNGISSMGKGYEVFATSSVNKWNDGAVFEFNDVNVFPIAGLTYFPNAGVDEIPVFRVSKVNGSLPAGLGNNLLLNGLLELNTDATFSGAGGKTFRNGIRGTATITQLNTGKIYLTAPGAVLEGTPLKINLTQSIDLSPATFIRSGAQVVLSGANLNNNVAGNLLEINGVLDVTTNGIANTNGKVILNGTFRTAHAGGFSGSGSSIVSGTVVLNPNCAIELYANGNQSLNARADFKNIILSGSGIKTPTGPFKPNGTITIKGNAVFDCSGNINAINIGDDNTNLTMNNNSRLIVSGFGPNPPMNGMYNLTSGVIEFRGSGATPQTIRNQTYQNIEVTGTNVNNSDGNILLNNEGTFTVKSGGTFTINDNTIAGPVGVQTVTVEKGGTFRCGNTKGFHGFAFTTAPKFNSSINEDVENTILQPNSTVEYSRASPPLANGDQPITNANNLVYQNLVLSGTGNKIAPSDNLVIQGNFSKTGSASFVHNNGTVIFNGNAEQTYTSTSPQVVFNVFKNQNSKGLNINDSLAIYKELSFTDNSTVNMNADVTLLSNKNQTASVSRLPSNIKINYGVGRFIVERYINTNVNGGHGKSWQLISTPAFGETIFNTWQEKGNKNIAGYGTWITDIAGAAGGFDAISNTPSMKFYDANTNNWKGISSTFINLDKETGYMIFVRGDRSSNTINSPATPTILRTRGKIYSNEFLPPQTVVPAQKFQCVGNPYASAIDFSKILRSPEIENSFRVWDPAYYGVNGLGGYQTISPAIGYRAMPGGSVIYDNASQYKNIQSGQAFFIANFSPNDGSVSFTEDCKMNDAHHLANRELDAEINERQILFAKLISQNGQLADGNAVAFDKTFSSKIDGDDALKISNGNENFGIKRNGKTLTVEAREKIKGADTIFYKMENLSKQAYKLFFTPEHCPIDLEGFLLDQYLKTETQIDLNDTSSVDFSITSDAGSAMPDRFLMVFKPVIIPLKISLNASEKNAAVFLEWNVSKGNEIKEFRIEHSTDGINFQLLEVIATSSNSTALYNYFHREPQTGSNYYRIRIDKTDGKSEYSEIVNILTHWFDSGITIFPNPFNGEHLTIQLMHQPAGKYFLEFINSSGHAIISKEINHAGGNGLQRFNVNRKLAHGIYYLSVKNGDREIKRLKLIY
ncbi:MAG: hypothetical protein ACTHKY_19995 [Ginsengibacter sp.]